MIPYKTRTQFERKFIKSGQNKFKHWGFKLKIACIELKKDFRKDWRRDYAFLLRVLLKSLMLGRDFGKKFGYQKGKPKLTDTTDIVLLNRTQVRSTALSFLRKGLATKKSEKTNNFFGYFLDELQRPDDLKSSRTFIVERLREIRKEETKPKIFYYTPLLLKTMDILQEREDLDYAQDLAGAKASYEEYVKREVKRRLYVDRIRENTYYSRLRYEKKKQRRQK